MLRGEVKSIMVYIAVSYVVNVRGCGNSGRRTGNCNPDRVNHGKIALNKAVEPSLDSSPPKRCCPYDFDSTLCKIIDDRVLCGFNKNVGYPMSKKNTEELAGGCRMRGGRLECGYEAPPFTNIRRPPVYYNYGSGEAQNPGKVSSSENDLSPNSKIKLKEPVTPRPKGKTCVEIDYRIVCKKP